LQAAAHQLGISGSEFIEQAVREKLAAAPVLRPQDELENAIHQAAALVYLLENEVCRPGDSSRPGDDIQCGLIELSSATFKHLRRASAGAFSWKGGAR
jgi:hypothetical protein